MHKSVGIIVGLFALGVAALSLAAPSKGVESGLKLGESLSAFEPTHVTGADKDTNTCPVCKYGPLPAAQVWVNGDSASNVEKIATTLEKAMEKRGPSNFKAFVVYIPQKGETPGELKSKLQGIASKGGLTHVAFAFLNEDSMSALGDYHINTASDVKNTVFVYSDRTVKSKFVNLKADDQGLSALAKATDQLFTK